MPPKAKITKEHIREAAIAVMERSGSKAPVARAIAKELGTSTQPIFSQYESMDELKNDLIAYAAEVYLRMQKDDMERGTYPPYKASGMSYIRFAKEHPVLFRLLFLCDRYDAQAAMDRTGNEAILAVVGQTTGLSPSEAEKFHFAIWMAVHGIATVSTTGYLSLSEQAVSELLTDIYTAMLEKHRKETV